MNYQQINHKTKENYQHNAHNSRRASEKLETSLI